MSDVNESPTSGRAPEELPKGFAEFIIAVERQARWNRRLAILALVIAVVAMLLPMVKCPGRRPPHEGRGPGPVAGPREEHGHQVQAQAPAHPPGPPARPDQAPAPVVVNVYYDKPGPKKDEAAPPAEILPPMPLFPAPGVDGGKVERE